MKIGIVSDTHDNLELAEKAAGFFEGRVDKVVHCGDIIAPFTAKLFDRDYAFYAVRGNNDGEWKLGHEIRKFGSFLGEMGELNFAGTRFAVYHGTSEEVADALVKSGKYDYVFRGHTHEKKLREHEGTVEINPGGIRLPGGEEEFHVAELDLETGDIDFRRL